jgi:dipeptidyl aminopeptidase/acylaminoacyl peptidase
MLAVVEVENQYDQTPPMLRLIELPSGKIKLITQLHPDEYDPAGYPDSFDRWAATGMWNQISWSSDGGLVAFNAVIDGESGDLYVYKLGDGSIERLTSGPTESVRPIWSPDGNQIVHGAVERLNVDMSGSGYDYTGVWSAAADGSAVDLLFSSDVTGFEIVLGWLSDTRVLMDSSTPNVEPFCRYHDLRLIDIRSGEMNPILTDRYAERAYDPVSQTMLFSIVEDVYCEQALSPGIYLLDVEAGAEPFKIVEDESFEIEWPPQAGLFFAETSNGAIAVSLSGQFIDLVVPEEAYRSPLAAPESNKLAWRSQEGLWIGTMQDNIDQAPVKVFSDWVHEMSWSPDGDHLLFLTSAAVFVASAPNFAPMEIIEVRGWFPVWVEGPTS